MKQSLSGGQFVAILKHGAILNLSMASRIKSLSIPLGTTIPDLVRVSHMHDSTTNLLLSAPLDVKHSA